MVVSAKNWATTETLKWYNDRVIYLIKAYYAIFFGLTQKKINIKIGLKVNAELVTFLMIMLFNNLLKNSISILSRVAIKFKKMDISFSQAVN